MSISQDLRAAARSAYRQLLRASSSTFSGDERVLQAFRLKIRQDAVGARDITDPVAYEQRNTLAREIAAIVRKNLVQATRATENTDTWRVRITDETELGSNDTIKNPPPMETSRRARRKEKEAQAFPEVPAPARDSPPKFYSALKKAHKNRIVPELREEDLEEAFVRGSGPGGQSVNKTENNVQLLHRPTGIRVTCHETRSLAMNRQIARRRLIEQLDKIQNPGLSKGELQQAKQRERERRRVTDIPLSVSFRSFSFLTPVSSTPIMRGKNVPVAGPSSAQDEYREMPQDESDPESDGYYLDQPVVKRRKTAKDTSVATKGMGKSAIKSTKGKRRSRAEGKLQGLLELPMDVFFEILCHLAPEYLVNLARMNRQFRSALMSPQSNFVWKAARQNIPGTSTPDPPSDMTEPKWANLLYTAEKACFECGKTGTKHIDFAFRRRLCLACRKKHLLRIKHNNLKKFIFDSDLLDLVPYTESGGYFGGWSSSPRSYWIPQLEAMQCKVAQYKENIKTGKPNAFKEYDDFRTARTLEVRSIMATVKDLESWTHAKDTEQFHNDDERKQQRYNAIVDRLVTAGYARDEIPSRFYLGLNKELQVDSVRPLTAAAWIKIAPKFKELLDESRAKRARTQRQDKIATAYRILLNALVPSQRFFLPVIFAEIDTPRLPRMQGLIDAPDTDNLSGEQFDAVATTSFLADTSAWALERRKAIAQAASLTISLPESVDWVALNDLSPNRQQRLRELEKIFDRATAVFVVQTWRTGSPSWGSSWPSRGGAPELPASEVLFIGRDAMKFKPDNSAVVFSARGADAVRAILALENLGPTTTTTELDARRSLFKCTHCSGTEADFSFTWRGCAEHFILKEDHTKPSWSLVPSAQAATLRQDGYHKWVCNHCAAESDTYVDVLGHVSQIHAVASPNEDIDLVYLPKPGECAPRLLSL
ncbi:hypothetical protein MVEN_02068100 [Mycena venus]|uniref:F-box domain-containing protein n=1 Tax=Mycena venus TaxID=2733690 RepID=A0A8H6XCA1_9AGAR|nr:hypothetical protein MVEN_02068100 [Mycena venus]